MSTTTRELPSYLHWRRVSPNVWVASSKDWGTSRPQTVKYAVVRRGQQAYAYSLPRTRRNKPMVVVRSLDPHVESVTKAQQWVERIHSGMIRTITSRHFTRIPRS